MNVWVHKCFPPIFSTLLATGKESTFSALSDKFFGFCGAAYRGRGSQFLHSSDSLLALQLPGSRHSLGIPVTRRLLNFKSIGKTQSCVDSRLTGYVLLACTFIISFLWNRDICKVSSK